MPTADRGPPQPPIPNTTSPRLRIIYLRPPRRLLPLLSSKTVNADLGQGGRRQRTYSGAWSGAWQCLRLLKAHHCLLSALPRNASEVMHNLQQTQHSSFSKVDSPSALGHETAASASRSPTVSRLQLRGLTGGKIGVFPYWDWIMDCTHCSTVWGRAASARKHKSFLLAEWWSEGGWRRAGTARRLVLPRKAVYQVPSN